MKLSLIEMEILNEAVEDKYNNMMGEIARAAQREEREKFLREGKITPPLKAGIKVRLLCTLQKKLKKGIRDYNG